MPPRVRTSLNGLWQVQPTDDESVPQAWHFTCPVPGLVDSAAPASGWKESRFHWYRTFFDSNAGADRIDLVIEQAMFGTEVWLNGTHLGGDIACYTSQEYDLRGAVRGRSNELIVRVGQRADLPPHSAVGKDQERVDWIPGIWGDVSVVSSGNPKIRLVQVIPHIGAGVAESRVTFRNTAGAPVTCEVSSSVREKRSGRLAGDTLAAAVVVPAMADATHTFEHGIPECRLWSVEDPFLYEVETTVKAGGNAVDSLATTFGMREFRVSGGDFLFNGRKILLRGGNIAFHRFLSDPDRKGLPWDPVWIRKILIDIPRAHHFNFFRNHIGQMYNRWYDIADEGGILIQNEWMFWTVTGTKEQIGTEFARWLRDNWNHPSIVLWDALNESSDAVVQNEIVPEMKRLDPTRPWESVDFVEEHPYIYSLGPVLNDRPFGFARSLDDIEASGAPSMLNEFCWWWLDRENNPSPLMEGVVERWLGPKWTTNQLVAHQSFLATELVELFRRMRVDAIQPFVYLSNNAGPTAHWFSGDIGRAEPKPVLAALRNAFSPFGISIELWDRHFLTGGRRKVRMFVFNDSALPRRGTVRYGIRRMDGTWMKDKRIPVEVPPVSDRVLAADVEFPDEAGEFRVAAELDELGQAPAVSEKIAWTFSPVLPEPMEPDPLDPDDLHRVARQQKVGHIGLPESAVKFLGSVGIAVTPFQAAGECDVLIVGEGAVRSPGYQSRLEEISGVLGSGGAVVLLEPEFGIEGQENIPLAAGAGITVTKRPDRDRGGYDSYVFAVNYAHPLWRGILKEHLRMFNGGYGGEIVSQHDVSAGADAKVLARCGLKLSVPAVMELRVAGGRVIISRIQVRGRLRMEGDAGGLFARRVDPVAQRYLLNLISYAGKNNT